MGKNQPPRLPDKYPHFKDGQANRCVQDLLLLHAVLDSLADLTQRVPHSTSEVQVLRSQGRLHFHDPISQRPMDRFEFCEAFLQVAARGYGVEMLASANDDGSQECIAGREKPVEVPGLGDGLDEVVAETDVTLTAWVRMVFDRLAIWGYCTPRWLVHGTWLFASRRSESGLRYRFRVPMASPSYCRRRLLQGLRFVASPGKRTNISCRWKHSMIPLDSLITFN